MNLFDRTVNDLKITISWDINENTMLSSKDEFDIDIVAYLINDKDTLSGELISNKVGVSNHNYTAIRITEDSSVKMNLKVDVMKHKFSSMKQNETLFMSLQRLEPEYVYVIPIIHLYKGVTRGQSLRQVPSLEMCINTLSNNACIARKTFASCTTSSTLYVPCLIYKDKKDNWRYTKVGLTKRCNFINEFLSNIAEEKIFSNFKK